MQRSPNRILLSVPHMGGTEFRYVQEAFDTNWLSTVGPNLNELEKTFQSLVGSPAVALSSGTSGLHLALRASGVRPGDEVVAQSLTFVASTNPILQEHARPILIDSDRTTWNIDPNLLSDFLSRRARDNRLPKAVMAVHLFGQPAAIDDLVSICTRYGVTLIEDAAESLGARYRGRHPGTLGHVGVFSFNGNKMITGTTGGMLVTSDPALAAKVRHWSTQAREPDPAGLGNYHHTQTGYNYRMSNVVAGIVRGQLEVLDLRVSQRRAVFARYRAAFADLPGIEPGSRPRLGTGPEARTGFRGRARWLVRGEPYPCRFIEPRSRALARRYCRAKSCVRRVCRLRRSRPRACPPGPLMRLRVSLAQLACSQLSRAPRALRSQRAR